MTYCRICNKRIDTDPLTLGGRSYHIQCIKPTPDNPHEWRGAVKWFDKKKGYGFVSVDCGADKEFFFHMSEYRSEEDIQDGDRVSFGFGIGRKNKPVAINVHFKARAKKTQDGKPYYGAPTYKGGLNYMFGGQPITATCLRCGGKGHVTAVDEDLVGFQCEKCGAFWRKRNKDNLSADKVLRIPEDYNIK